MNRVRRFRAGDKVWFRWRGKLSKELATLVGHVGHGEYLISTADGSQRTIRVGSLVLSDAMATPVGTGLYRIGDRVEWGRWPQQGTVIGFEEGCYVVEVDGGGVVWKRRDQLRKAPTKVTKKQEAPSDDTRSAA